MALRTKTIEFATTTDITTIAAATNRFARTGGTMAPLKPSLNMLWLDIS